jgi:hypothetical protein
MTNTGEDRPLPRLAVIAKKARCLRIKKQTQSVSGLGLPDTEQGLHRDRRNLNTERRVKCAARRVCGQISRSVATAGDWHRIVHESLKLTGQTDWFATGFVTATALTFSRSIRQVKRTRGFVVAFAAGTL